MHLKFPLASFSTFAVPVEREEGEKKSELSVIVPHHLTYFLPVFWVSATYLHLYKHALELFCNFLLFVFTHESLCLGGNSTIVVIWRLSSCFFRLLFGHRVSAYTANIPA